MIKIISLLSGWVGNMELIKKFSDEPLTKYLSIEEKEKLMSTTRTRTLMPGENLIRQGEVDYRMFFIESGYLDVIDERLGSEAIIASLTSGDVLGEMAFLNEAPRSATVKAKVNTVVKELSRNQIRDIVETDPALFGKFMLALSEILSDRMRATLDTLPGLVARLHKLQKESDEETTNEFTEIETELQSVNRWLRRSL